MTRFIIYILILFSLSGHSQVFMYSVASKTDKTSGAPEDTTDIYDIANRADYLITPDSARNSSGNAVSSGDEVYQWNDYLNKYTLTDRTTRPGTTNHFDTIPFYYNNDVLDSMPYVRITNKTDGQWFDNTIAAGDTAPFEYYYVLMPLQTALNEKFYNGAFTIEDNGNSYLSTRYNGGGEVDWQSSGGNWIPPFNKICVFHQIIRTSGYTILEIDTGTGYISYGDSVDIGTIAGVKMTNMQLGTNTRAASQRMYMTAGKIGGLFSENDRTYIEAVINDEFNVGAYPYGGRVDNASWSFETSTNVFTMTWDHATRSGGTVDSVNIKLHHEDETDDGTIWVERLFEVLDTTNTSAAFGDANGGTFTFDRDDYPGLSNGSSGEYIKAWLRVYVSNVGWSDWFESTFIINNAE